MKKKSQTDEATVQTTIRLPREMYEGLTKGGAQFGAEVRRHLEESMSLGRIDPKTRALMKLVAKIAQAIEADGRWHEDAYIFEIFKAGVLTLLSHYQPVGDPGLGNPATKYTMYIPDQHEPDMVGQIVAQTFLNLGGD